MKSRNISNIVVLFSSKPNSAHFIVLPDGTIINGVHFVSHLPDSDSDSIIVSITEETKETLDSIKTLSDRFGGIPSSIDSQPIKKVRKPKVEKD